MDDGVLRSNAYVLKGKDMTKFIDNRLRKQEKLNNQQNKIYKDMGETKKQENVLPFPREDAVIDEM